MFVLEYTICQGGRSSEGQKCSEVFGWHAKDDDDDGGKLSVNGRIWHVLILVLRRHPGAIWSVCI